MDDPQQRGEGRVGRGHIARRGVMLVSVVLLAVAGLVVAWQLLTPSGLDRQERRWLESEWSRTRRRARLESERAEQATYERHLARAELSADAVEPPSQQRPRRARGSRRRLKPRSSYDGVAITMYMTPW